MQRRFPRLCLALLLATVAVPVAAQSPAGTGSAWGPLQLLQREIAPGQKAKFSYQISPTFEGAFLDTIVFVARGRRAGPTLCLTALIHGDERNSFEIVRQSFAGTDAEQLAGTLIALPAVNSHGFRTGSRNMPDRRDLNRFFPGNPGGSNTSLVASIVFSTLREQCSALVDLHTGSFERANVPQVRVDLAHAQALDLARYFGATAVLGGTGPEGSLRREMMAAGIPTILYEAGLPLRFEPAEIARGVAGVRNVMLRLRMLTGQGSAPTPLEAVYSRSAWARVPVGSGGVYYPMRALGDPVRRGDIIAEIFEPFTDQRFEVASPHEGRIVGMAVPKVVFSGFALVHVAWR